MNLLYQFTDCYCYLQNASSNNVDVAKEIKDNFPCQMKFKIYLKVSVFRRVRRLNKFARFVLFLSMISFHGFSLRGHVTDNSDINKVREKHKEIDNSHSKFRKEIRNWKEEILIKNDLQNYSLFFDKSSLSDSNCHMSL